VAHVCTMTPVALMVGSNRVVTAVKIVNPMGNADLEIEEEKALRRSIAARALEALQSEVKVPTLFERK
jgi:betaine reductase